MDNAKAQSLCVCVAPRKITQIPFIDRSRESLLREIFIGEAEGKLDPRLVDLEY